MKIHVPRARGESLQWRINNVGWALKTSHFSALLVWILQLGSAFIKSPRSSRGLQQLRYFIAAIGNLRLRFFFSCSSSLASVPYSPEARVFEECLSDIEEIF
jgi:hypothetical protein